MSESITPTDSGNPALQCGGPPVGGDYETLSNLVSNVVGDACFYGCFVSALYNSAIIRYSNVQGTLTGVVQSVLTLGKLMLREPGRWTEEQLDYIEDMVGTFTNFLEGTIQQIIPDNLNFSDVMWSMLKTMVCRYAEVMLLAAVQELVYKLRTDLDNRAILLGNIVNKLNQLESDLNDLSEYDWWKEFVEAVDAANLNLGVAQQELYRAYTNAQYGQWDREHTDMAQWRILAAIQKLASSGMIGELLTLFSDVLKGRGYDPMDPAFFSAHASNVLDAIDSLGSTLGDLKEDYDCLMRTTSRIKFYKALIMAAEDGLDYLSSNQYIGVALDVLLGDNILWTIATRIGEIRADMRDVVLNNKRIVAPIHAADWRNELQGHLMTLRTFSSVPQPFNLPSYATNEEAKSALNYILHTHNPPDGLLSLEELNFGIPEIQQVLSRLIATTGNLTSLFLHHDQWSFEMNRIRSDIGHLRDRDAQASNMLQTFSGYENEKYDYVTGVLKNAGWTAAKKMLESGMIGGFLNMSIIAVTSGSTLFECLSGVLSKMGEDIPPEFTSGLQLQVARIQDEEMSEALASARAASMLPALQFKVISGLQSELEAIQGRIEEIMDIAGAIC